MHPMFGLMPARPLRSVPARPSRSVTNKRSRRERCQCVRLHAFSRCTPRQRAGVLCGFLNQILSRDGGPASAEDESVRALIARTPRPGGGTSFVNKSSRARIAAPGGVRTDGLAAASSRSRPTSSPPTVGPNSQRASRATRSVLLFHVLLQPFILRGSG